LKVELGVNTVKNLQGWNLRNLEVMSYPGKNHGISGGKTREQLFTMITNFIRENL